MLVAHQWKGNIVGADETDDNNVHDVDEVVDVDYHTWPPGSSLCSQSKYVQAWSVRRDTVSDSSGPKAYSGGGFRRQEWHGFGGEATNNNGMMRHHVLEVSLDELDTGENKIWRRTRVWGWCWHNLYGL